MKRRWLGIGLVLTGLAAGASYAEAQARIKGEDLIRVPDSAATQIVKLRDGSTLIGRFAAVTGETLVFETSGGRLTLRRADVAEVKEVARSSFRGGAYWPADPNPTRLFFGPTARSLPRGEGDFSNTYLFLLSGAYGVGSNAQLGGGFSVFPFEDFSDNLFFLTGKIGFRAGPNAQLAVGALVGGVGLFGDDLGGNGALGAFYGVGTFGNLDHSLTLGVTVPFFDGEFADNPVILVGGETRIHKNIKLVTENHFAKSHDIEAVFSYGLRIFNEKIAVGFAFLNSSEGGIFPGVPYVDFVVRF